MDANGVWYGLMEPPKKSRDLPRILIIGAGSRGTTYARNAVEHNAGIVVAVAEPIEYKRNQLGKKYIWKEVGSNGQAFSDWREFVDYERDRRSRAAAGEDVPDGVDAAFICTLDEQHAEIVHGLAPLNLHIMCEKPLATTLEDCLNIYTTMQDKGRESDAKVVFGIGHVLRYSPHNMMLRDLVRKQNVIGDILSVEHVEPVGWWHFSHSYVRGNWRKEAKTAPSLLTKSCHDIDFLMWLLCSPTDPESNETPHVPSSISSSGDLNFFRRARKPKAAGTATNCLSCPIEDTCSYSAKKIYAEKMFDYGTRSWPVDIVCPDIEDVRVKHGLVSARKRLLERLSEDYDASQTPPEEISKRPWFGRCVWDSDNDVCDDQYVTLTWEDDGLDTSKPKYAKTANFHMIAQTEAQCERRGRIYGTQGEITYDSKTIRVYQFGSGKSRTYVPEQRGGGHGGGDSGLVESFLRAVDAVKNKNMKPGDAQRKYLGCTLEEEIRSHAVVFAAEEARHERKTIAWKQWWDEELELSRLYRQSTSK